MKAFWAPRLDILFLSALFPGHFLWISNSNFRRLGLPNRRFRIEGIAKTKVRGLGDSTEMCPKTPSKIHYIFNGFWEAVGLNCTSKNH